MSAKALAAVLVAFAVVASGTAVGVLFGVGPAAGMLAGETERPPELTTFVSAGAQCTDDFRSNASSSIHGGGPNTEITYRRNVSLPDPSYAIGDPTFERVNESTYRLSVPTVATTKAPRDCRGVARYEASMRIPAGEDRWHLLVEHDGERVTRHWGESNSSLTGGSASAGSSVSAGGNAPA